MTTLLGRNRPMTAVTRTALAGLLAGSALIGSMGPAFAQDTLGEARIRKMEAEIRALQRQVFPGSADGKVFAPEIAPGQPAPAAGATAPASTPVTDLLTRMDSVETQLARLTAQVEQTTNRLTLLEARFPAPPSTPDPAAASAPAAAAAIAAPAAAPAAGPPAPAAADSNLAAMSGGASTPRPAAAPVPAPVSAAAPAPAPRPAPVRVATPTPAPAAVGPSPRRVAAVRAIEKPSTSDAGDDEYSYGFRLWEAKFYPEAQQQLKMFVDRYPRHERLSYARNLLGRAYLDDGKPREAATWFLQNYQSDKRGARAPDSLVLLAESMRQLSDTSRACIALAEFGESYAAEAAGRLKAQYDATRAGVTCNK